MKNIFKVLAIFAIIGTIVIIGCKEDDPPPPPPIAISMNKNALGLIKGKYETETLTATVTNTANTAVTWVSSLPSVATVNNGVVTAIAYGTTVITATTVDGGKTADCTVTVIEEIEMVKITAGNFTMGQTNVATPTHSVTLTNDFYMGKYEVTQEQYLAVMGSNPSNFTAAVTGESGTPGKLPVERVSWYDAIVFCNKLSMMEGLTPAYSINSKTNPVDWGTVPTSSDATWDAVVIVDGSTGYRLPTEAQWEYACRAGTTTLYNTNKGAIDTNTGWYKSNSESKTHEVGKKSANAWKLYDMHGNVWEWCWDWYGSYLSEAQTDPLGASSGTHRVDRGGSWDTLAEYLRSAYRDYDYPSGRGYLLGFRLVRP